AVRLAEVVGAEDVPVGDATGELDLLLEAVEERGVVLQHLVAKHLERDHLVELAVVRAVDDTHAALADRAQDVVAPGEEAALSDAGAGRGGTLEVDGGGGGERPRPGGGRPLLDVGQALL